MVWQSANTRLEKQVWRMYCQILSCASSAGQLARMNTGRALAGHTSFSARCQPALSISIAATAPGLTCRPISSMWRCTAQVSA